MEYVMWQEGEEPVIVHQVNVNTRRAGYAVSLCDRVARPMMDWETAAEPVSRRLLAATKTERCGECATKAQENRCERCDRVLDGPAKRCFAACETFFKPREVS